MFIMSSFLIPLCALMHAHSITLQCGQREREGERGESEGRRERGGELREVLSLLQLPCVW